MDNFTFRKVEDDVASNVGLSDLERKGDAKSDG
jgi:hypothetical protein